MFRVMPAFALLLAGRRNLPSIAVVIAGAVIATNPLNISIPADQTRIAAGDPIMSGWSPDLLDDLRRRIAGLTRPDTTRSGRQG